MRRAVEIAEEYADGLASPEELEVSHHDVYRHVYDGVYLSAKAETMGVTIDVYNAFVGLSLSCGFLKTGLDKIDRKASCHYGAKLTCQYQPLILRDIFGNP